MAEPIPIPELEDYPSIQDQKILREAGRYKKELEATRREIEQLKSGAGADDGPQSTSVDSVAGQESGDAEAPDLTLDAMLAETNELLEGIKTAKYRAVLEQCCVAIPAVETLLKAAGVDPTTVTPELLKAILPSQLLKAEGVAGSGGRGSNGVANQSVASLVNSGQWIDKGFAFFEKNRATILEAMKGKVTI
jgi:hypothetical protein